MVDMGNRGMQTNKFDMESGSWHYVRSKMNMDELALQLAGCLGSANGNHVEDQTGLKGDFQVAIDCPSAGAHPSNKDASDMTASDPQGGITLSRSLDALGLKLEKHKLAMDIYVIDHVDREPTEN